MNAVDDELVEQDPLRVEAGRLDAGPDHHEHAAPPQLGQPASMALPLPEHFEHDVDGPIDDPAGSAIDGTSKVLGHPQPGGADLAARAGARRGARRSHVVTPIARRAAIVNVPMEPGPAHQHPLARARPGPG